MKKFLQEHFEKNLNILNENWGAYQEDNTLNKLAHLTKGNILFAEGRCDMDKKQPNNEAN